VTALTAIPSETGHTILRRLLRGQGKLCPETPHPALRTTGPQARTHAAPARVPPTPSPCCTQTGATRPLRPHLRETGRHPHPPTPSPYCTQTGATRPHPHPSPGDRQAPPPPTPYCARKVATAPTKTGQCLPQNYECFFLPSVFVCTQPQHNK
jgi:hypothetical protein